MDSSPSFAHRNLGLLWLRFANPGFASIEQLGLVAVFPDFDLKTTRKRLVLSLMAILNFTPEGSF
jgi:hypothetical protein